MDGFDWIMCIFGFMLLLMFILGVPMAIWASLEKECYKSQSLKLVSVNGMHDGNTGLFSGGTVNQKTLLFDNGLVITKSSMNLQNLEIRIGKYYKVRRCFNNRGSFKYKIA